MDFFRQFCFATHICILNTYLFQIVQRDVRTYLFGILRTTKAKYFQLIFIPLHLLYSFHKMKIRKRIFFMSHSKKEHIKLFQHYSMQKNSCFVLRPAKTILSIFKVLLGKLVLRIFLSFNTRKMAANQLILSKFLCGELFFVYSGIEYIKEYITCVSISLIEILHELSWLKI